MANNRKYESAEEAIKAKRAQEKAWREAHPERVMQYRINAANALLKKQTAKNNNTTEVI